MERWVNRRWSKKGAVHVMDLEGGYFLIRFSDQGDYAHAFFEGPWMIVDHYLLIQRWRPLFIPKENEVQKVAVWVRIPNLPTELYNRYFLWKVGKSIGTMLKVDEHTSIHSRGKFARICVEIDIRKKLVPSFSALGKEFNLVYEGLHQICFNCGKYGHRIEGCPDENKKGQKETRLDQQNYHAAAGDLPAQNTSEQIPIPNQKGKKIVMEKNQGAGLEEKAVANNEQSSEIFTKNKVADTIDEENNQETNMEKQDIANLGKKEGGNQTSKEDQQGGRVEASLKLQGAGNKKNIFNKANKGKNTENSRKFSAVQPKSGRIKDVQQPLAPKGEKEHNHKEGSRKQDKEHQEYWNQFNNLLKGIYKSHQQGNHIDFNEPFNPLLSNLIAKTMGGGRPEGESSGTLKDKPPEINQDEYMNMIMDGRHDKQPVQISVGEDEEEEYGPKPMDD
ncbi:hypothetical protein AHAS_Ahas17G0222900 [Arachis hypogaea]